MARYVNAEDVERLILENLDDLSELMKATKGTDREKLFFKEMGLTDAIAHLYEAPTVDVREVIRCKDCTYITEHYDTDGNAPYWTCSEWDSGTDYDGFCHYAERRGDE